MKQLRGDKRDSRRRNILNGARIARADGSLLDSCIIVDFSQNGARLGVQNPDAVPEHFLLLLSHDGRLRRQCSVVWRSGTNIGVEFVPNLTVPVRPR